MAANENPNGGQDITSDSTIPLGSDARRPNPPGDATCDLPPAESGAPTVGGATCEYQYAPPAEPPQAAPPDGTCEFTPGQMSAPAQPTRLPQRPGATLAAGREQPVTLGDATGEFQPETAAGVGPVMGTVDFSVGSESEALGRQTALRSPGALTQPTGVAAPAAGAQRAGRYDLKKFHAKGGMGEVWLAQDPDIGRPVALKRMLKGRDKQKMNFVKEAQVTGQLEHPGVIPVHELSLDETGQPFYIMKFVHGQTLKEVIKEYHEGKKDAESPREVQWLRLLNIFLDLCQTIAYAHSRGVLHRDIKPDNVMVGAYGETLVLDWGLAKVIGEPDAESTETAIQLSSDDVSVASITGTVKGTPYYFAPEVAAGKVDQVDQVSDVYLLGATLYFMIANRTPREGKSLTQLLEDARKKVPVPPRQLVPTVSKPLDAICQKAMAYEKQDRYQSATALAEDVQRYLAGEPVSAYQENLLERTWRWVKRHRTGLGRAAAGLLIAAIGVTAVVLVRDVELRRLKDLEDAEIQRKADVQAVELREKTEKAKADKLKREKDAGQEIENFKARTEEARFYAASANPVGEDVATVDAAQAELKAKEALDIAAAWGPDLDKMPLEDKRAGLKKDLYDLLLEMAQLKSQQDIKGAQTYLERAVSFQPGTQGYYRLRARGLDAEGKKEDAELARKQEADAKTKATALDYYLLGEQSRIGSLQAAKGNIPEGKQDTLKDLQARREIILGEAMKMYREALRVDPNHYWSHFQLAVCYNGLGKYAEAAEAFGTCVALQPKKPWGYSSRGLALSNIKDRQKDAEDDLGYALKLDPAFRPAQLHRAQLYVSQKKFDNAEADFAAVLAPPKSLRLAQAFLARANMNMVRKDHSAEALADYQRAIDAKIRIHRSTYLNLTRMHLVEEKLIEALDSLTLYLEIDKKDDKSPRAFEARGRELRLLAADFKGSKLSALRLDTLLLAILQLEQAEKLGGNTASLFDEMGSTAEKLIGLLAKPRPEDAKRRLNQAMAAYSRAITLAPKDHKTRIKRGWAYVNFFPDANAKAKADFAAALAIDPDNAEAHAGFGYTAAMLKSPDEALEHATKATLYDRGDYILLHNVACIYGALIENDAKFGKRYENQALAQLARAVEIWEKIGKTEPSEIDLIVVEGAFPASLRARPEFKKLIGETP